MHIGPKKASCGMPAPTVWPRVLSNSMVEYQENAAATMTMSTPTVASTMRRAQGKPVDEERDAHIFSMGECGGRTEKADRQQEHPGHVVSPSERRVQHEPAQHRARHHDEIESKQKRGGHLHDAEQGMHYEALEMRAALVSARGALSRLRHLTSLRCAGRLLACPLPLAFAGRTCPRGGAPAPGRRSGRNRPPARRVASDCRSPPLRTERSE